MLNLKHALITGSVVTLAREARAGHRRVHRPWVAEPGPWVQYDFGDGPVIDGRSSVLFVAWSAFSRFRVVFPIKDKTIPSVFAALDRVFRVLGGAPTYVLTDNEKTVTTMHIAGVPVRNTQIVSFARYYGVTVLTCQPADPATKGGAEASVKLAKADIVPTDANLRPAYSSWDELDDACQQFMGEINGKVHHVTKRRPPTRLLKPPLSRSSIGSPTSALTASFVRGGCSASNPSAW